MKFPHVFRHLGTAAAAVGLIVALANSGGAQGASRTLTVPVSVIAGKSEPASGLKSALFTPAALELHFCKRMRTATGTTISCP